MVMLDFHHFHCSFKDEYHSLCALLILNLPMSKNFGIQMKFHLVHQPTVQV